MQGNILVTRGGESVSIHPSAVFGQEVLEEIGFWKQADLVCPVAKLSNVIEYLKLEARRACWAAGFRCCPWLDGYNAAINEVECVLDEQFVYA